MFSILWVVTELLQEFVFPHLLLLREYWNLAPNNTNIRVKEDMTAIQDFLSHNALCVRQRKLKLCLY